MKLKNSYFFTKREDSKDEESVSANLLVRSGMIKKAGSGIYYFLPMGHRVTKKIEKIVREEMNAIDSQELVMPQLLPEEVYIASGRRENFGNGMFSLKDRFNRSYVLGPTHEEMFVEAAKEVIKSHKDMPISLYQMANKYRDEPRSRYGLIRTREFVMKDAYTFDKDEAGLAVAYDKMYEAYKKIFDRVGLDYKIVTASCGVMGGTLSEEFQAVCDIGEDVLVLCDKCGLATNIEVCECVDNMEESTEEYKEKELLYTPMVGTIKDLEDNYNIKAEDTVKTLIYKADGKFVALMIRGDHEVNEEKVQKLLGAKEFEMATIEEDEEVTGAKVGFAGPIDLDVKIIVDNVVSKMRNFLVGANKTDYHYINVNLSDFKYDMVADIRNVTENDVCPKCGAKLSFKKGIEVGNTFKLGTKYSEAMDLYFADEDNKLKPVVMGCYGIGIARILAAVVEQNHDENGMILPKNIAPYEVSIVIANVKDEEQVRLGNELYDKLNEKGIEVLLDDRNERAGVKFKDMDLIGIPVRVVVGKKANEGIVEYKERANDTVEELSIDELLNRF
ncbi:MAG: proline--tRNA ligase [Bacilli bacterium]|nr:proline--tRNA ligase [Bacilli bacterium]